MARCLALSTQPRNWRTSSGLRIMGTVCGFLGAGITSAKVQSFLSEISQCRNSDENGTGRQLLFVSEIHLIGADVLRTQLFRRFVAREQLHVAGLRIQREIPNLHVFGHALPKGCHEKLFLRMELLQAATPWFRTGDLNTGKTADEPQGPRQRFGRSCHRLPRSGLVGKLHVQFERRTVASSQARHLRPDSEVASVERSSPAVCKSSNKRVGKGEMTKAPSVCRA
jgi:hypothetical protein